MLESANNDLWYVEQELAGHDITVHKQWFSGIRPQVAVATIAHSAKYVREFFPETIGAYFVQDYEAEFNPLSDGYVRGQNSYAQGLAPICIGHWLPHVLRKQFGIGAAYGGLGVDTSIYYPIPDLEKKDMVAFLYQPEKWRSMPETCIAALAIVKQRRPQTEIVLYGSNVQPDLPFQATQRGLIHDLSELNRIYNEASVGLCLSLTNPSRIPIEYMAAGCVPVDLYRYNNLFDNPTGTSLLAYQSEASIAEAILHLLENQADCKARRENGIALAKQRTLTWEVDTAVNAVRWLLSGGSVDKIQTPECTYHQDPIVASADNTREVVNFCKWQKKLSGA
jgi:glycosyltransferase involved in cell wall biosynthesis